MASSSSCYNHDDRRAVSICMDCRPDSIVKYCKDCHDNVHSLSVFRLHKTQSLNQGENRRLSQDVSDLEKLVVVERDLLNGVLTTLRYTEQHEREMLQDVVRKTEQRLHAIQQCHEKVDKALLYLAKVSTVIASCSSSSAASPHVPLRDPSLNLDITQELPEKQDIDGLPQLPVEIVGSLVKTGCFWMIKKSVTDRQKLLKIEHELKDYYKEIPAVTTPSPPLKEGTVCAARNHSNTEFWRIRVDKLCPKEMVKVRYLDYGMQEELPLSCVVDLPSSLRITPFQALECCLFPLTAKVSLPYEAKWCFKDLTHGKDLTARICSQMIYPQGNSMYHVQLTSAGPPPININQKVADLLAEKTMDEEDRTILPKDEPPVKAERKKEKKSKERKTSKEEKVKEIKTETSKARKSSVTETKVIPEPDNEITSQDPAVIAHSEPVKKYTILSRKTEDKVIKELPKKQPDISGSNLQDGVTETLRHSPGETNSLCDTKPQNGVLNSLTDGLEQSSSNSQDSMEKSSSDSTKEVGDGVTNSSGDSPNIVSKTPLDVSMHDALKRDSTKTPETVASSSMHGALKCDSTKSSETVASSSMHDALKLDSTKSSETVVTTATAKEFVPVGYLNKEMYNILLEKYKSTDWQAIKNKMRFGRFFMTKGSPRQFVEAIKTKIWCVLDDKLMNQINRVYKEQAANNHALFLIFVSRGTVAGLVEIVSEKRVIPHCSVVIPGLMWGQSCSGEFNIEIVTLNQFKFRLLENESFLWNFFKDYISLGREIRYEKGQEICYRFEHLKLYFPMIQWGLKEYLQQNQSNELTASQENLSSYSEDEDQHAEDQAGLSIEDWEPDLEAQPARVAEIYSNISSPPGSVCSHSDRPEDHEDFEPVQEVHETNHQSETLLTAEETKPLEAEQDDTVFVDETPKEKSGNNEAVDQDIDSTPVELKTDKMEANPTTSSVEPEQENTIDSTQDIAPQEQHLVQSNEQGSLEEPEKPSQNQENESSGVDEACNSQTTPSPSAGDEQIPSYMPYGQALPTDDKTPTLPDSHHELPSENVNQVPSETFYAVSPPRTPKPFNTQSKEEEINADEDNGGGIGGDDNDGGNDNGSKIGGGGGNDDGGDGNDNDGSGDGNDDKGDGNDDGGDDDDDNDDGTDGDGGDGERVDGGGGNEGDGDRVGGGGGDEGEDDEGWNEYCSSNVTVPSLSASESVSFPIFNTGSHNTNQDSHDLLEISKSVKLDCDIDEEEALPFLPVEKGGQYTIFACGDPAKTDGKFWARLVRNARQEEEFRHFERSLTRLGRSSEPLSHVFLLKNCLYENSKNHQQRGLITKIHQDKRVDVRLIDIGKCYVANIDELKELDEKYLARMPPQAFECQPRNISQLMDKWKRYPKKSLKYYDMEVEVRGIKDEVVEIDIINLKPSNASKRYRKNQ